MKDSRGTSSRTVAFTTSRSSSIDHRTPTSTTSAPTTNTVSPDVVDEAGMLECEYSDCEVDDDEDCRVVERALTETLVEEEEAERKAAVDQWKNMFNFNGPVVVNGVGTRIAR